MESEEAKFVVAVFEGIDSAESALKVLMNGISEDKFDIQAAMAMAKDEKGRVRYKDVGLTPTKGAFGGLLLGGAIGLLTGGTGLVLGALGGLVGGVMGRKKRDERFSSAQVNQVLAGVRPGTSALLMVLENRHLEALQDTLGYLQAELFVAAVPEEIADELRNYQDEAYSALDSYLE